MRIYRLHIKIIKQNGIETGWSKAVFMALSSRADLLLQYTLVMMRSRRRRPQAPASGPSMSGVQNMEVLASAVKHVLVYHLLFSLHSIKKRYDDKDSLHTVANCDIYRSCYRCCTCIAGLLCIDSAPCQLGSRSFGLLFL